MRTNEPDGRFAGSVSCGMAVHAVIQLKSLSDFDTDPCGRAMLCRGRTEAQRAMATKLNGVLMSTEGRQTHVDEGYHG